MSQYVATISWQRNGAKFTDNQYSRAHRWKFDGGIEVPASSSPHIVRVPMSDAAAIDPEEAFIASLSSCHMLWFLVLAAAQGFVVDSYHDDVVGVMAKNARGKIAMTLVTLHPKVSFTGKHPTPAEFNALHHSAHEECYIASSVKTEMRCEAEMISEGNG